MAKPKYKALSQTFIAPFRLEAGSVIETDSIPGPHLLPLNDEAQAKLEEFYEMEVDVFKKDVWTKEKVYAQFRPQPPSARPKAATVALVSGPPADQPGALDLASAQFAKAEPMIGPPKAEPEEADDGTVVVSAASPVKPIAKAS